MAEQPFMLVSLEEAKAKKLAQVLNNETCTKILNDLARGKGTETEIAKRLKLPLSTVHYNLKQLVKAKLVVANEFHYSEKGREVNHYHLANKYIIIAPEEDHPGFLDTLKRFLPVALITAGVALVLKLFSVLNGTVALRAGSAGVFGANALPKAAPMMLQTAQDSVREEAGAGMLLAANNATNGTMPPLAHMPPSQAGLFLSNGVIIAFLVGGLFAIAVLILLAYIRHLKRK